MSRVFWDTNIFIYFFEDHGQQGKSARASARAHAAARRSADHLGDELSGEILVKPRERQDLDLCRRVRAGDHLDRARPSVRPERGETILSAAPRSLAASPRCHPVGVRRYRRTPTSSLPTTAGSLALRSMACSSSSLSTDPLSRTTERPTSYPVKSINGISCHPPPAFTAHRGHALAGSRSSSPPRRIHLSRSLSAPAKASGAKSAPCPGSTTCPSTRR